jgi:hypothetical protein
MYNKNKRCFKFCNYLHEKKLAIWLLATIKDYDKKTKCPPDIFFLGSPAAATPFCGGSRLAAARCDVSNAVALLCKYLKRSFHLPLTSMISTNRGDGNDFKPCDERQCFTI